MVAFIDELVPALFWATAEFALLILAFNLCFRAYSLFRSLKEQTADFAGRHAVAKWIRLTWNAFVPLAAVAILLGLFRRSSLS